MRRHALSLIYTMVNIYKSNTSLDTRYNARRLDLAPL
jgi:hypothetical protein